MKQDSIYEKMRKLKTDLNLHRVYCFQKEKRVGGERDGLRKLHL